MRLSLRELRERREQGRTAVEDRRPSGIPVEVLLEATGAIGQPVSLAQALTGFGLSLDAAHDVLNRLVANETVPVTLHMTPEGETPFALCRFGLGVGQVVETRQSPVVLGILNPEAVDSFEGWRLSQPAQPAPREALRLMVRKYLIEHGLLNAEQDRRDTEPSPTE